MKSFQSQHGLMKDMLVDSNSSIELLVVTKVSEMFKAEVKNLNGSQIATSLSKSLFADKSTHLLQKIFSFCCKRRNGRGRHLRNYGREGFDVKTCTAKKTETFSKLQPTKFREPTSLLSCIKYVHQCK